MSTGNDTWEHGMNAVQNGKCTKYGSKKHETKECSVDLSKVRCFRCSQYGQIRVVLGNPNTSDSRFTQVENCGCGGTPSHFSVLEKTS